MFLTLWYRDHAMSLRRRFIVILALTALLVILASAAVLHVVKSTDEGREHSAREQAQKIASRLAESSEANLEATTVAAVPTSLDAAGGFCTHQGEPLVTVNALPPDKTNRDPLPPDLLDAVAQACANVGATAVRHPHDVVEIVSTPTRAGTVAWAAVRVLTRDDAGWPIWLPDFALLFGVMALLVVMTLLAMASVRRDTDLLVQNLQTLSQNLSADVRAPTGQEFARLGEGVVSMARNLASARDKERELQNHFAEAERLGALGRVVAGVAHEIRNPLTGLKLKLDVMKRSQTLPTIMADDLEACLSEISRLDGVVNALLVVARKPALDKQTFALHALVAERVAILLADRANEVAIRGEAQACAHRPSVARIIDNLLRNAVQASARSVSVEIQRENMESVSVAIGDAGAGVEPEHLRQLFEPFFTTKPEGTGLGLWICRTLAEGQGGSVTYARREEQTHFVLRLQRGDTDA
jgi:signal transduction histidine kinase